MAVRDYPSPDLTTRALAPAPPWPRRCSQEWKRLKIRWRGLSEFARTALTVASDGCYWAVNDLKRDHDSKIGLECVGLCLYDSEELACGGRGQVHMGNLGSREGLCQSIVVSF